MKRDNILLSREFLSICVISFGINMGQFMSSALIPVYTDSLGASATIVGLMTSVFAFPSLLSKPILGPAVDTFYKKNMLLVGIVLLIVSFCGFALSKTITELLIYRIIHGLATGSTVVICLAMLSDTLPVETITSGVLTYSMVQALATAIGPGIGLELARSFGYSGAFFTSAALIAASSTVLMNWPKHRCDKKTAFVVSISTVIAKNAVAPSVIMLFLSATYASLNSFLVLYAQSVGVYEIGLFFTVNALSILIARPIAGKVASLIGTRKILPITILSLAIGMVVISFSKNLSFFLIAAVFVAFGYGTCQPLIQALCVKSVPVERRGSAISTCYCGVEIGYIVSPVLSGFIVENSGYSIMFRVMIIFLALAVITLFIARKSIRRIDLGA